MAVSQELQVELGTETLLEMYWLMTLSRKLDERAWVLTRQAGRASGRGGDTAGRLRLGDRIRRAI